MTDANFHINTSQYLGQKYSSYKDDLYGVALSRPTEYFAYRKAINKYIKEEATKNLYDTIFFALKDGKKHRDGVSSTFIHAAYDESPNVPEQTITEIALAAAKTIDKILSEVVEIIAPLDYRTIANKRLEAVGNVQGIDT